MTQTVTVDEVLSAGRGGGAIFRAILDDGRKVRIVADRNLMPRPPVPGEVWRIGGVIRRDQIHGSQVHAREAALDRPSGRLLVGALARNPAFPNIGPIRAQQLWDALGEDLVRALDEGDFKAIATVLEPTHARTVVEGWKSISVAADLYGWLDRHGLGPRLAKRLIDIYGHETIAKLEENPYRLLAFSSWAEADRIARSLGVRTDDRLRLVAAAEAAVYRRLNHSHTWTGEEELTAIAGQILGCGNFTAAIEAAVADCALVQVDGGLQGLGPWSMERFIAQRTAAMLSAGWRARQPRFSSADEANALCDRLDVCQAGEGLLRLNAGQREAVLMALSTPLAVLAGGAGVGKTTALRAIHRLAEHGMRPIWQMALSGRAAKRMEEATARTAMTIAAFLTRAGAGEIDLEADWLLIIDEASMLDLPTLYRILRLMRPGHGLLLVGDPGQLPPIGFGLTFHALAANDLIPRVELTEVHRQAASTGIPQASAAIREGRAPSFMEFDGRRPGVSFIDITIGGVASAVIDLVDGLGGVGEVQIVGAIKHGPGGVRTLNAAFHDRVGDTSELDFGGFAVGEPVMWTRNDYNLGLRNGSLGRVIGISETLDVLWDDGARIPLTTDLLQHLDHAYAITCHKAQGSQFRRVIVPVFKNRLLDRTLLYTAVTRAQEQVVLVGDRAAFTAAIVEPPMPSRRVTAIEFHLRNGGLIH